MTPEPTTKPPLNPLPNPSLGLVKTEVASISLPPGGLKLECGQSLPELQIAYETYGNLSPNRDNAVFICHALSGDAHVAGYHSEAESSKGWWNDMIGPGKGIDTHHYFVVCANVLGGCKGTTGPSSVNPATGKPYGSTFPPLTVGDMVSAHRLLLTHLGIERLAAIVGGSFGGMQALEWAIRHPDTVDHVICIASAVSLSTQALAFDVVGREAITSDPAWQGGNYYDTGHTPDHGLAQARKIGHITYLSQEMMTRKFGRERGARNPDAADPFHTNFQIESYLDHQGRKFLERFDANSYLHITKTMDEFDLSERFGSLEKAFIAIRAKILVVALTSDWLFPREQSVEIANALLRCGKHVSYCCLNAPHGHDAFLVDVEHLAETIRAFLPWVSRQPAASSGSTTPGRCPACRMEFNRIMDWIQPGSRVLDVGCGGGELLSLLRDQFGISGIGIDIDLSSVLRVLDGGHDVFQGDIDDGLAMIPDRMFDYAILSETLQTVRKPNLVLRELLRVAGKGLVTFPNFANWSHRHTLLRTGRMPKGGALPFEWYNTPNIHLFTLKDFIDLCHQEGISIIRMECMAEHPLGRLLVRLGFRNLGAERVLVKIARGST